MMLHRRFLIREMFQARKQAAIFILCVALSITTLVALNSFRRDVDLAIAGDSRALHGGDVLLHSHYDFSPQLLAAVAALEGDALDTVRTWEFYSVVRTMAETSLFCNIKVVGPAYPLYGEVVLQSGRDFRTQLVPGQVVVAPRLLDRLDLAVGDVLRIGGADLRIVDVVLRESSRPVDIFNFGPRVFVAGGDLPRLDLIRPGSRVEYEMALKVGEKEDPNRIAARLQRAALDGQERVETYRTARSGVKRFFDNLLFFLSLSSIFTLLLAGIGMQSSLSALLREKQRSLAIAKALGATHSFLFGHYLLLVLLFGLVGSVLGVSAGVVLKYFFPRLFAGLVPAGITSGLSVVDVGEGMLLGLVVVCFFTFLPLYRLKEVKPNAIFRSESGSAEKGGRYYLFVALGLVLLTLLVIRQLADVQTGIYFMLGVVGLILVISLMTRLVLAAIRRLPIPALAMRQAVKSLLRPGNSSRSIIVTLASALSVLLAIFLVKYNLHATYVESYPEDAPNLFILDIQDHQRDDFRRLAGTPEVQLFPIIRARLTAINDSKVNRREELAKRRDSLAREFNLTYRDSLLPDETLLAGRTLFARDDDSEVFLQVSILDMVAEMGEMGLGDTLHFNIQGMPLAAKVTSIRTRTKSKLYPFFYFVFPPKYLRAAPQTFFAALHVEQSAIPQLENRIVATFPNISVVNVAQTASELGQVMNKLSRIVSFFASFSILAGGLIIVSSILATRMARVREAVYYKVLGGKSGFVLSVFVYENLLLAAISSTLGVLLAQAGSWALCWQLFEIPYRPYWPASLILVGLTTLLVVAIGILSSLSIIRQKPALFLREQFNE